MRERRADVLDAEHVDEELRQLVDLRRRSRRRAAAAPGSPERRPTIACWCRAEPAHDPLGVTTASYPSNASTKVRTTGMQTSVCARVVIASGTGAGEQADHYYCTSRGQNPMCNDNDQAIYDGDIVKTDNEMIALQGMDDPPPIMANQWRKQALAVFGAGPTHLRFWDADASWPGLATPPEAAIQARGDDSTGEYTQRGAAGVMAVQDIGRVPTPSSGAMPAGAGGQAARRGERAVTRRCRVSAGP